MEVTGCACFSSLIAIAAGGSTVGLDVLLKLRWARLARRVPAGFLPLMVHQFVLADSTSGGAPRICLQQGGGPLPACTAASAWFDDSCRGLQQSAAICPRLYSCWLGSIRAYVTRCNLRRGVTSGRFATCSANGRTRRSDDWEFSKAPVVNI